MTRLARQQSEADKAIKELLRLGDESDAEIDSTRWI